jgi:hypothetical protein
MDLHTNSSNNTIFADASGSIAYFHANFVPQRDTRFDWSHPVDGSVTATEWQGVHTIDESPLVHNPASGWLYNANNWPSPTLRALQTARLAKLGEPQVVATLGDRSGAEGAAWLKSAAAERPAAGANTLLITHAPNVMGAFAQEGQGMADGEMLVIQPDGAGGFRVAGRIGIDRWPVLEPCRFWWMETMVGF